MTTTVHRAADTTSARVLPRRYRIAVAAMFTIAGITIGAWSARLPAVQHQLELTYGWVSVALLALAGGGLVGM